MRSKKPIFVAFLVCALLSVFSQAAIADYTVTPTGSGGHYGGYGPYQTGNGGEFTLVANADLQWVLQYYVGSTSNVTDSTNKVIKNSFQSFCLEKNEYLYANQVHNAVMSNAARNGGGGAKNNEDPISMGTAWLYSQFTKGTLSGYNYGAGRSGSDASSAALLQNAIWWLEGETSTRTGNTFIDAVIAEYGEAGAVADSKGAFGIKVLNLTQNGQVRQDVLVATPIPAAVWLLGTGLIGLAGFRRKVNS